jgi:hypothetical protein
VGKRLQVAFAKLGKAIKFKDHAFTANGGDNEPGCLLMALANNNPGVDFWVVGKSDMRTMSPEEIRAMFPWGNVHDPWRSWYKTQRETPVGSPEYKSYILDYFEREGVKIDHAVVMMGAAPIVTIPGTMKKTDPKTPASVMVMAFHYCTPITYWLNASGLPWMEVINDPRYTSRQPRDLYNHPRHSLAQYDYHYISNHLKSEEDQSLVETRIEPRYAGVETLFCVGRKKPTDNETRAHDFMVVLNEGRPSRFTKIREWVLGSFPEASIYGKWVAPEATSDPRFKGSLHIDELQRVLQDVKSTLAIPIAKGWVTSKYVEMIHAGVVPFLHPTYDEQRHVKIPEMLRVKTPRELKDRVELLARRDPERRALVEIMRKDVLLDSYYDGTFISDKVMGLIHQDLGIEFKPERVTWEREIVAPPRIEEPETSSLEAFF